MPSLQFKRSTICLNGILTCCVYVCLCTVLLVCANLPIFAQETSYYFEHITHRDGLPQTNVRAILKDEQGFIWAGTDGGLTRFDGYDFVTFRSGEDGILSSDLITALVQTKDGILWVGTRYGLNRFDPMKETATPFFPTNPNLFTENRITALHLSEDEKSLWVGSYSGLYRFDLKNQSWHRQDLGDNYQNAVHAIDVDQKTVWAGDEFGNVFRIVEGRVQQVTRTAPDSVGNTVQALLVGRHGKLYIGTLWKGLFELEEGSNQPTPRLVQNGDAVLDNVNVLAEDYKGRLWIGAWNWGLTRISASGTMQHYVHEASRSGSLGRVTVLSLLIDTHQVWVGLEGGGMDLFRPETEAFQHWHTRSTHPLNDNNPLGILEDRTGHLWVATMDGGINRIDPITGRVVYITANNGNDQLLDNKVAVLSEELDGTILIGSRKGLQRFDPITQKITTLHTNINENWITAILRCQHPDFPGIFFSVMREGVYFLKDNNSQARLLLRPDDQLAGLSRIECAMLHREKTLWLGTNRGLIQYELDTKEFKTFHYQPNDEHGLPSDHIMTIVGDPSNSALLWLGTTKGLSQLDIAAGRFKNWQARHGLGSDTIYSILFDDKAQLWMSTNNGIIHFNPENDVILNYTTDEGLPFSEFNIFSGHKSRNGTMYFGGIDGLVGFRPESLEREQPKTPLVITSIEFDGQRLSNGQALDQSGPRPVLKIPAKTDQVAIELASLDFSNSKKKSYTYILDGLDSQWTLLQAGRRVAAFNHLPSGNYVFHAKARDEAGNLLDSTVQLELEVATPLWLSLGAKIGYGLLAIGLIIALLRLQEKKLREQRALNDKLAKADRLKDQILANTSHELRTPVHGIIGLAESLLADQKHKLSKHPVKSLEMLVTSGKRLARLIDDLLDVARFRDGEAQLIPVPVSIKTAIDNTLVICRPLLNDKNLILNDNIPADCPQILADEARLEQILINLVANAIKFTREGSIDIKVHRIADMLQIDITDTGIGIPADRQEAIFEEFQQVSESTRRFHGGTGLGLPIARKLVQMQGGKLWVVSSENKGSTFSFTLPIVSDDYMGESAAILAEPNPQKRVFSPEVTVTDVSPLTVSGIGSHHILAVDDDSINLQVLQNHLTSEGYQVTLASNGEQALELLEKERFDLILLDIMMPGLSGFDVCSQIRRHFSRASLPIIFLSARERESDRIGGLDIGANDYLNKPISRDELLMRIRNQILLIESSRHLELLVEKRTTELRQAQEELVRTAHLAGMGEIAAEVMHSMGNAINSLTTSLQVIEEMGSDDRSRELLDRLAQVLESDQVIQADDFKLNTSVRRVAMGTALRRIIDRLGARDAKVKHELERVNRYRSDITRVLKRQQDFANERERPQKQGLNDIIQSAIDLESALLSAHQIDLQVQLAEIPDIFVPAKRMSRVILCLLVNAREAILSYQAPGHGRINIHASQEDDFVILAIIDNGPGFEADVREDLFHLGYTTKKDGSGFGLHYCANAIKEIGGSIQINSDGTGKGARVRLQIPIAIGDTKNPEASHEV